ncbi:phosphatidate cytidylyltransferase [Tepiditoga spiralis]|nr:phosphatidate cytidylyltransferase [Tepiditoga spiralis]
MRMPIGKKNLFIRASSGFIIGPVVVFSYLWYPTLLGLVTTIVMMASYEFIKMSNPKLCRKFRLFIAFLLGITSMVYGFSLEAEYSGILPFEAEFIFVIGFLLISLITIVRLKDINEAKELLSSSTFSLIYIAFFLSSNYLTQINYGAGMAILALTSVWAYDSFAYIFGLTFGKHKISPTYSPKKSWEGLFGGIFGTFLYIIIYDFFREIFGLHTLIDLEYVAAFAIMVGIVDTIGDLTESIFKRFYNVKDSSGILPGHGGMLDRIDGLLLVVPIWYFMLRLFWI